MKKRLEVPIADDENRGLKSLFFFVLLIGGVVFLAANVFVTKDMPTDLYEQLDLYTGANMPQEAERIYERLLPENRGDLDLNYHYIVNHSQITDATFANLQSRYESLAQNSQYADVAFYSLGLIASLNGDYMQALSYLQLVEDTSQKYLNNSIGFAHFQLENDTKAEGYFWLEIEFNGNVIGAVSNLEKLYTTQGNGDGLRSLLENPETEPYVSYSAQRMLSVDEGDLTTYLNLVFIKQFNGIELGAGLSALVICVMFFFYFWRIDVFEQEPFGVALAALLLGVFSAPFSFFFSDALHYFYPLALGESWLNDLIYSVVYIGAVEELAKFIMVIVVVAIFREANEPLDLLIYGSLVGLGFATLENSLYFSSYGLGIVFSRFLLSTTLHMALTATICYLWARARFIDLTFTLPYIIWGLIIAAVLHGLFDYFILSEFVQIGLLSIVLLMWIAISYGKMLNTCLNFSPFFDVAKVRSKRLDNYVLLSITAVVTLIIVYIYNFDQFTTEIANTSIIELGWTVIVTSSIVFGSLGEFNIAQGQFSAPRSKSIVKL